MLHLVEPSKEKNVVLDESLIAEGHDTIHNLLVSIVESSEDAILTTDLNGTITSWSRGAERIYGYTAEEAMGKPIKMLFPADRENEEPAILERIRRGHRVDHYETVRQRKYGGLIDVSVTVSPIRNIHGKIVGASKSSRDMSERKRLQQHQQFLVRELEHRTSNLFSVIQHVVNRSLEEPQTLAQAKDLLNGRLQALARAHGMMAAATWVGAPLADIIRRELAGFSDQTSISGCDIIVSTPAAQQFALTVHELATNAVKYGALSAPAGLISIACDVEKANGDGGTFSFRWKETGGPEVLPPKRKGFGTVILLDAAKQFGKHSGGSTQARKSQPGRLGFISVGILKRIFRQVGTMLLARPRSMTFRAPAIVSRHKLRIR
jgi:PAS domain S-box-containing protein